jgi:hypothetical protein
VRGVVLCEVLLEDLCEDQWLLGVVHPLLIWEGSKCVLPNEGGLLMASSPGVGGHKPPETVWWRLRQVLLSVMDAPLCVLEATVFYWCLVA